MISLSDFPYVWINSIQTWMFVKLLIECADINLVLGDEFS